MVRRFNTVVFVAFIVLSIASVFGTGCANMIPPTGGARDSLPPVLVTAAPKDSSIRFTGNRIVLTFDEFVDLQSTFENVIVSPLPKTTPTVNSSFRTVTVKLKDTLEPNTTYSINFGNSIRDINEGNVLKDFRYVFSTGDTLDQQTVSGSVMLAENGKIDTTLIVVLHRNTADSAVSKLKPRYMARLDGKGKFQFYNLPRGIFALYALPNDYSRMYDDSTRPFAFADSLIQTINNPSGISLYAYTLTRRDTTVNAGKIPPVVLATPDSAKADKQLKVQVGIQGTAQDLLTSLSVVFSRKLRTFDSTKFILTDTLFKRQTGYHLLTDTFANTVFVQAKWQPGAYYKLLIDSMAVTDSSGKRLAGADTLSFSAKKTEDYGSVKIRFTNIDLTKNPVLQLVQNDRVVQSVVLTQREWYQKLILPGEYDLRILFDKNKNGVWDPGQFAGKHIQPERVLFINTKLSIRANWDNEKDITF